METTNNKCMRLTNVDVVDGLLKMNASEFTMLSRIELNMNGLLERGLLNDKLSLNQVTCGFFCAVITSAGCRRARVVRMDAATNTVTIRFCDYGSEGFCSINDLRLLDKPEVLPPRFQELSEELWLADALVPSMPDAQKRNFIEKMVNLKALITVYNICEKPLVKVMIRDNMGNLEDLAVLLMRCGLMIPTTREHQLQLLQNRNTYLMLKVLNIDPASRMEITQSMIDTPANIWPRSLEFEMVSQPSLDFGRFSTVTHDLDRFRQFGCPGAPFPSSSHALSAPIPRVSIPLASSQMSPVAEPCMTSSYFPPVNVTMDRKFSIPTFSVGSVHNAMVCCIIDGPGSFAIHLLDNEVRKGLWDLTNRLNLHKPEPFPGQIFPGALCLATFSNDLCRGIVSGVSLDYVSVYFVDFGYTIVLSSTDVYEIPSQFLVEPVFAHRFTLANLDHNYLLMTEEAHLQFQNYKNKIRLRLIVSPPVVPVKQYCELFEWQDNKWINIADIILKKVKDSTPISYKNIVYEKDDCVLVNVTYAVSPVDFFVQRLADVDAAKELSTELTKRCKDNEFKELLFAEDAAKGLPVCAKFGDVWRRAQVVCDPDAENFVTVEFVDFGNTSIVRIDQLRRLSNEFIKKYPKLATPCQLKKVFEETDSFFNRFVEIVRDRTFIMRVLNFVDDVIEIDLLDDQNRFAVDLIEPTISAPEFVVRSRSCESARKEVKKWFSRRTTNSSHGVENRRNNQGDVRDCRRSSHRNEHDTDRVICESSKIDEESCTESRLSDVDVQVHGRDVTQEKFNRNPRPTDKRGRGEDSHKFQWEDNVHDNHNRINEEACSDNWNDSQECDANTWESESSWGSRGRNYSKNPYRGSRYVARNKDNRNPRSANKRGRGEGSRKFQWEDNVPENYNQKYEKLHSDNWNDSQECDANTWESESSWGSRGRNYNINSYRGSRYVAQNKDNRNPRPADKRGRGKDSPEFQWEDNVRDDSHHNQKFEKSRSDNWNSWGRKEDDIQKSSRTERDNVQDTWKHDHSQNMKGRQRFNYANEKNDIDDDAELSENFSRSLSVCDETW